METFKQKIPEIEESLAVVKKLAAHEEEEDDPLVTRYSLADAVYGKAEVDTSSKTVGVWLGANVMLEYTYEEAIELLSKKDEAAKREFQEVCTSDCRVRLVVACVHVSLATTSLTIRTQIDKGRLVICEESNHYCRSQHFKNLQLGR